MSWTVYGVRGWGSTLAEAALAWVGAELRFDDVAGFDHPGPARDRLARINPMVRVPTMVAPDGHVMTESAALVLHLAEAYPEAGLAPAPDHPDRRAFLSRLMWLVSAVYPTFTYRDYPDRWSPAAPDQLVEHVDRFRETLWRGFDGELPAGEWVLPSGPSALDLYVAVMTQWEPGRDWFAREAPALHAIAERAEALPALAPVFRRNFPEKEER